MRIFRLVSLLLIATASVSEAQITTSWSGTALNYYYGTTPTLMFSLNGGTGVLNVPAITTTSINGGAVSGSLLGLGTAQQGFAFYAGDAGGTSDAITATVAGSPLTALVDGMQVAVAATASANTTSTPTFNLTLGTTATGAITIVKGANAALVAGDLPGPRFVIKLTYDATIGKWVLNNPYTAVAGSVVYPKFRAYMSAPQTVTANTWTKVQNNTKLFDTNNNYDATTNYRFTPTVAGYYLVTGSFSATAGTTTGVDIRKNGATDSPGVAFVTFSNIGAESVPATGIVFLNGTTDYVEIWGYTSGTTFNATTYNYFSAAMLP